MEAAPLFEDVARSPAGGQAWWVKAADGEKVRVAAWPAGQDTTSLGTVLMFPGRTEYIEKYGPAAAQFSARGFASLALDWRGQGLTARAKPDRRLGHVDDFLEYQNDVAVLVDVARRADLPKPWFLLGHSMGGCIGLRALHGHLPVRAAVFSGPLWGVQLKPIETAIAWAVALLGPPLGFGDRLTPRAQPDHKLIAGTFEGNDLTTDVQMWEFMKAQIARYPDLALGGPTIVWFRAMMVETARLTRLPAPDIPALSFLATRESIVNVDRMRRLMARWPKGRLETVEGAKHELMMERAEIRTRFFDRAAAFFRENG
ncbi:MAG: alpha/beta hydrolase [Maritimibacter sp.]|nr:alpha/beta hydrolase [Maritimibacter sp.]